MADTKKKANWTAVKKALAEMRREELINTIGDLYKLRKDNKEFLHIRFRLGEMELDSLKDKISQYVAPKRNTKISFQKARRVLSDYKKASGDMEGLAELMVHYCAECTDFMYYMGNWEQYADASINIWLDTLKHLKTISLKKQVELWNELEKYKKKIYNLGWGVSDVVNDEMYYYEQALKEALEEVDKTEKPQPERKDMW